MNLPTGQAVQVPLELGEASTRYSPDPHLGNVSVQLFSLSHPALYLPSGQISHVPVSPRALATVPHLSRYVPGPQFGHVEQSHTS